MSYQITNEDIDILVSQTNISKDLAKKLLKKHKGDIVSSIIAFESGEEDNNSEIEEKDDNEEIIDVKVQKNLTNYREIVDEKDTIYQTNKEKKENGKVETLQNLCNEEKYFMKRKKEGNINVIHVL